MFSENSKGWLLNFSYITKQVLFVTRSSYLRALLLKLTFLRNRIKVAVSKLGGVIGYFV